jgi:hypothetical protein
MFCQKKSEWSLSGVRTEYQGDSKDLGAMDISTEKLREMERQETTEEDKGNGGMWKYEEQLEEEKVDEE